MSLSSIANSVYPQNPFQEICLKENDTCPLCKRVFDTARVTIYSTARTSNKIPSQQQVKVWHQEEPRPIPGLSPPLQSQPKPTAWFSFDWLSLIGTGHKYQKSVDWERPFT